MKPHSLVLVISLLLSFSCGEDVHTKVACFVGNPVEDLNWLAAKIDAISKHPGANYNYVTQATYRLRTVFIFSICCAQCLSVAEVYNCSGHHVGDIGIGKGAIDPSILDRDILIWKSDTSYCHFQ